MDDRPIAERAQRLAVRAVSLARTGADRDASALVLAALARGDVTVLDLACARCRAAADQDPADTAALEASTLLVDSRRRLEEFGGPR